MGKKLRGFVATVVTLLVVTGLGPVAQALDMGPIYSGETRSGTITVPNGSDVWSFTCTAGDVLTMKGAHPEPSSRRVTTEVRDAANTLLYTIPCNGNGAGSFTLPATGTYTATVKSCYQNYVGGYYLTFQNVTAGPLRIAGDPPQEGGAIVSGQTVEGVTTQGDLDAFLVRVDPGERLILSVTKLSGGPNPLLWLFPPATAPDPWVSLFTDVGDRQEMALSTAGTYTVVMQSEDSNKNGTYYLTLQKIPGASADCYTALPDADGGIIPAAPTANVAGSIVRGTDMDAWEFYATAAQTATVTLGREMRLSLFAPLPGAAPREFGAPVYSYLCGALQTTHNVTLPTTGFYELLLEQCTIAAGGAYTVSLTLPAQTAPPPLASPAPAACGPVTNVFASDILGWDPLPAATGYQVFAQEPELLGPITDLGTASQPPSGRPVFPLPYDQLQTGTIYNWHVAATDGAANTYSPTYSFGLFCTPTVTVSPSSHDFGDVLAGATSAPVTVTITNTGTCYEDPRVVNVPSGFAVAADTCTTAPAGGHLAPAGSCSFQVTFSPTSQGTYAGGLTLGGFLPEAHGGIIDLAGQGVLSDLQVVQVSDPAQPNPDGTFSFTDITRNAGTVPVPATTTTYRLSLDQKITRLDPTFALTRAIPALTTDPDPAHYSSGTVTLTVPADAPRGTYYVAACADGPGLIGETSEANNCRLSKTTIRVEPDLAASAVSNPPAAGYSGMRFDVTDTTRNGGLVAAAPSSTNYRLSLDQTITAADSLLTGSRPVPRLDLGGASSGTVAVTIPATMPQGTFYLGACADGGMTVVEGNEANNCTVSTTTITIARPDLEVTAIGEPPAGGTAGLSFSVTDTVRNNGAADAAATVTNYRLSLDTTIATSDPALTGTRAVPALAALGATSSGGVSVTIPANVAPGLYYLGACADGTNLVNETSETNNCLRSAGRITISAPDLQVTAVSNPPASGGVGTSFPVTDTTANGSASVAAVASVTRYRLTADAAVTPADPLLTGTRAVPALGAGASSGGTVTVSIPDSVAPGTYFLAACADDPRQLAESSETNNCLVSATSLEMRKADLAVSAVSNPPGTGSVGDTFTVDDTTVNSGAVAAVASTTRYYLSSDQTINGADTQLEGSRAVAALAAGAGSAGSGTVVTIPASVPQGSFYLGACADAAAAVPESNESNNCRASTTLITIVKADLRVASVSDPPEEGDLGQSFDVTDATTNAGQVPAAASTTRYRLSLDTTVNTADLLLTGTRAVPALGAGATSTGTVSVTIPATVVQGSYYLAACADFASAVPESAEDNNCAVSAATIDILNPDLRVAAVSDPPAEGFVGTSFSVTDTTANAGAAAAATATTTRYRLSPDAYVTTTDPLLTGTRAVAALAAGAVSTGTLTLSIPATIAQGVYYLAACADDAGVLTESNETNNCLVAAATIHVKKPDLQVTALGEPPAEGFVAMSFSVSETTENLGLAAAAASTTRYRLSRDRAVTTADPLLTGTRAVPGLAAGAGSPGAATVTIPATITQGEYYLAACADDAGAVSESAETNNCRISAGTISLKKPDLQVTAVTSPPAGGTVGTSFSVTDTTANAGIAAAGASTTRYRLSPDQTITGADLQLTGLRAVGALAVGAGSTAAATVTIPAAVVEGTYYLAACADEAAVVSESDETNNCLLASGTIEVRKAELGIAAVSDPPAGGTVGASFSVSDTTLNAGLAPAGSSVTAYRLSLDRTITAADPLLTGTRGVGALGAGGSSAGAATVTIPAAIPQGVYYLGACADQNAEVAEVDEQNNCSASAGTIDLQKADLTVSALSDPPAEGTLGGQIVITDTTTNAGGAPSVASTTRYRISADQTITSADSLLTEVTVRHSVPALGPGAGSTASISVVVPTVAEGHYYIGACADEGNLVSERFETNNCRASAGRIWVKLPDLAVTAVSDPPAEGLVGTSFGVTDTVTNGGLAAAGASTTRYRLSLDTTITAADPLLTGTRSVGALAIGASATGTVTVSIPRTVQQGVYYLAACADNVLAVLESDETNNCLLAATTISLKRPDLLVTAVGDPPAAGLVGTVFTLADTTVNSATALAAAGASATRFRLSTDGTITSADPLLTGSRAVGALAIGEISSGSTDLTIPASVPQGTFYLAACADDAAAVPESDETNNCAVSAGQIRVRKPDLQATAVSDPPLEGVAGTSFSVTDTTGNDAAAEAAAGASTTLYRLTSDTVVNAADPLLTGSRAVGGLAIGASSTGTVTVTLPDTVPQGTYYLAACADDANVVSESIETNNCKLSGGQIQFKKPDLRITAVSDPPAAGAAGDAFDVTDTTLNDAGALAGAPASATRYRLSADQTITTADPLLTGSRAVGALAVGGSSTGTSTLVIPASVAQGTYYLAACADDAGTVSESDETNNCRTAGSQIVIRRPDLTVAAVSDPPPTGLPGSAFTVDDTVTNAGQAATTAASTVRYRLSPDPAITGADLLLTGTRTVGPLAVGANSAGSATQVTVPASAAQGLYYLGACADDTAVVAESSETNNCSASAGRIQIMRADLTVSALGDPQALGVAGGSFTVVDTVTNAGLTATTLNTTTRYRLSPDTTITTSDPLLTGTRTVGPLAAGASSVGSGTTVTVPSSIAEGDYFLGACADATSAVVESNESNNCRVSTTTINLWKADLAVASFSLDPPPADPLLPINVSAGWGIVDVAETTQNLSARRGAAATSTRFVLSSDETVTTDDPRLAAVHAVPALAPGETSSVVSLALGIPATVAEGYYWLYACADDTQLLPESSEANCVRLTMQLAVRKSNLYYHLSSPNDAALLPGQSTIVWGSVTNGASGDAGPSTTRFRLSTDATITGADPLLAGTLASPAIAAGAYHDAPATVTIPAGTPAGTYYLAGCADDLQAVSETDETDNCGLWSSTFLVQGPDLAVSSVAAGQGERMAGEALQASDTTANGGHGAAAPSGTRYYLSTDAIITTGDRFLGIRQVPALAAGAGDSGSLTVTVPISTPPGTYYLGACADGSAAVAEESETNNCGVAATTVQVTPAQPDLAYTIASGVPSALFAGQSFTVSGSTVNPGTADAGPSTTRFRLSDDATITSADWLLSGSRAVPYLQAAAADATPVTLTVPTGIPAGSYYFAACADDQSAVIEHDETNNCAVWGTMLLLQRADLQVSSVTGYPAVIYPEVGFPVTETVTNAGPGEASAFDVEYRLSSDATITTDDQILAGTRTVAGLAAGADSSATATRYVMVAPAPPAPGTYYLGVCADPAGAVPEGNELNNCLASGTTVQVMAPAPDLAVTSVSNPPASAVVNTSFSVTDTTYNDSSLASALASTTRHYLSGDHAVGPGDWLLAATRSVPALAPVGSSAGTVTVQVPVGVPAGYYHVLACADDLGAVTEHDESNNCTPSANTVQITARPDLTMGIDFAYTPGHLYPGLAWNQAHDVANGGGAAAGAFITRFYLSTDTTFGGSDPQLGQASYASLGAGEFALWQPAALSVPTTIAEGEYYLGACIDAANAVTESIENNNCSFNPTTYLVRRAALSVPSFGGNPTTAFRGGSFSVTDTTQNSALSGGDAVAFTNSYYLSADATITTGDAPLSGTRSLSGLAAGASSTGSAAVTVPAGTAPGTYYVGVCADSGNAVAETVETNNCRASATMVQVMLAVDFTSSIDYTVPSVIYHGQVLTVSATAYNAGLDPAATSASQVRLSTDTTITSADYLLTGLQLVPALASGGSYSFALNVTVPGGVPAGSYYFAVCADDTGSTPEPDETNNCAVWGTPVALSYGADLQMYLVWAYPPTVTRGVDFSVSSDVYNGGLPSGPAGPYYLEFRISTDATVTTADPLITGTRYFSGTPVGGATAGPTLVSVPLGMPPGTYYLGVCADSTNMVPELDETNNCGAGATTIVVQ